MSEISKEKSAPETATSGAEKSENLCIFTSSILDKAKQKVKSFDKKKLGQKEKIIAEPTANALISFCEQSEEFARAVCDGKDFAECLKEISKDFGSAVSDFEVYSKAVEFYFPGAVIKFEMKILMSEHEADESVYKKEDLSLSLDSLLDW